jgi:hypothetical protein
LSSLFFLSWYLSPSLLSLSLSSLLLRIAHAHKRFCMIASVCLTINDILLCLLGVYVIIYIFYNLIYAFIFIYVLKYMFYNILYVSNSHFNNGIYVFNAMNITMARPYMKHVYFKHILCHVAYA